jgi:hypothetical protein
MAQNVWKGCLKVTLYLYLWDNGMWPICTTGKTLNLSTTTLNYFFGVAFQEYFTNELHIRGIFGFGEVPW